MRLAERETPKVLIVEDEMLLRMRAVNLVEDAGFHPVQAVDSDEAISILEGRSDISLLFTDIQMPGSMDGLRLAHAVHDRWPSIKIILVSGHISPTEGERPADSQFFGKPLNVAKLIPAMQAMVRAGDGPGLAEQKSDVEPERQARSVENLTVENDALRLLLEQAGINALNLLAQSGIEAEERAAADKLQKLIVGELHHRIKNTLATVSAIASQSFRCADSIEEGQIALDGRLLAIGRAHDLLLQTSWSDASLIDTLNSAIEPYQTPSVRSFNFNGPDIRIHSSAVIALSMTFNELCTNATKFGSLSKPGGWVDVAWATTEKPSMNLSWRERDGPAVSPPTRRSFGTRMMESLGQQLRGRIELTYNPVGFSYELDVPLSSLEPR